MEKGKASLSRSKSELGEQHKKMISHWSKSKNELSEQNKKILNKFRQKKENENDLDGLMKNLGLDVMNAKRAQERNENLMSTSLYSTSNNLEKTLENDYGEFEYIDEGATLTRTLGTNGESKDQHRKSMFSFSDEVFDELEKSGTLKKPTQNTEVQTPIYETYGAWRARNQRRNYYNNNSVTNNTSAKLQALIADQTLLLRHHKKRQQAAEAKFQQEKEEENSREEQLQSLLLLQKQLAAATKEHLEGNSVNNLGALRRCSSLSQTNEIGENPQPPAKINGTSPLTSSPWLSNSTTSKYLYRGKFQPSSSNNNNNKSPWQLRSNLSSFARRRRGSSTSLHNFSDNDEETEFQPLPNKQPDSISLAGSEESVNHR